MCDHIISELVICVLCLRRKMKFPGYKWGVGGVGGGGEEIHISDAAPTKVNHITTFITDHPSVSGKSLG